MAISGALIAALTSGAIVRADDTAIFDPPVAESNTISDDPEYQALHERVRALEQLSETWQPAEEADESEPVASPTADEEEESFTLGGAIRANYNWRDYSGPDEDKVGDYGFELFRIDANGEYGDLGMAAQYRWYAFFECVQHAYVSYDLSPEWEAQLGIHQVPFGLLPYASHSFWFGATYYMGFEDDYDTGLKLLHKNDPWEMHLAFYKNPEYIDSSRAARYSFDLITRDEQQNEETNQGNFRLAYNWEPGPCLDVNFGVSVLGGQIYNRTTRGLGDRFAYSLHTNVVYRDCNVQLQWINYQFRPNNPSGVDPEIVQLGAFDFPFLVAAEGDIATINVARTFPINGRLVDSAQFYADFSKVYPTTTNSRDSTQLVLGCLMVAKKRLNIYVDWIIGQNMWFVGGPGIGLNRPDSDDWRSRLNINVGFYF